MEKHVITVGPYGGPGGNPWDDGVHSTVRQLVIYSGWAIDSIQIEYDQDGKSVWSPKHGGDGGDKTAITLEFPAEYLVSISGHFGNYEGNVIVRSLTIQSNKKQYGPYGRQNGDSFSTQSNAGKIIGFLGRSGAYLNAIGAYIRPVEYVTLGPYGGPGGSPWDDGIHSTVRQVVIYSGWSIDSIQIEYDEDGKSVWSPKHGGDGGDKTAITLEFPAEYLVSISGHFGNYEGNVIVRSLTIQSNKKQYGPYGRQNGDSFSTQSNAGKIIGFLGRSGTYLNAIGAYIRPVEPVTLGPYGGPGGSPWDDGIHSTVRQVVIYSGWSIDSIQIEYDEDGKSVWSPKHGGDGGDKTAITLEFPAEYLVSISGHFGNYEGNVIVRSLTIQSNKKQYGPYGRQNGDSFSTQSNAGKIIGFLGRSGTYLNAIGAHIN